MPFIYWGGGGLNLWLIVFQLSKEEKKKDFLHKSWYFFSEKTGDPKQRPIDCGDVKSNKESGIYKIYPKHSNLGFDVYCDFEVDNTGWTVGTFIDNKIKLTKTIFSSLYNKC